MLPREYRLTRSRDFVCVRRRGRSAGSALATLYVLPGQNGALRIGFSVSKRVGKATIRNRVKRLFREAVRQHLNSVRPGFDLVFIARPAAAHASYQQILDSVSYLLRKAGALCRPVPQLDHA